MKLKRLTAALLVLMMVLSFAGCNNKNTQSENVDSTVSDTDIFEGDTGDEDVIVGQDDKNNSLINSGSQNNSSGGKTQGGKNPMGNTENYGVDKTATEKFFETVPRSLRGKTVKVLSYYDPSATEKKKMEVFKEKTGITIKWITTSYGTQFTKLAAMIGQDNPPDLAPILQGDFPAIVMQNYFQPLSSTKLDLKDKIFDIDSMNQFKWNGNHYGAILKSSTQVAFQVIIFNKSLFARSGVKNPYELWQSGNWNWDTFISTCTSIKSKAGVKYGIVGDYGGQGLALTAGGVAVKFNGNKIVNNINDPLLVKGYQFVNDLASKYNVSEMSSSVTPFQTGESAMMIKENYVLQKGDWLEKNIKFEWGFAPAPCPKGSGVVIPSEYKAFGFPKGAKNVEAASYWLRYWFDTRYDPEDAQIWTNSASGVAQFNSWLWDQKKVFYTQRGIITYGADYNENDMDSELCICGSNNVSTVLKKWSDVIDTKIKTIMNDSK